MTTLRGRRYIDADVQEAIQELALRDHTPSQILRKLERKKRYKGRLPVLRTIQRIARELTFDDYSGRWSLKDYDGEGGRLILDVLGKLLSNSRGKEGQFTKAEANWVLKIRQAAPDLDLWKAWLLARLYMLRERNNADTDDLDAFLALTPWIRAPSDFHSPYEKYKRYVNQGWVRPVWSYLWMTQRDFYDRARLAFEEPEQEEAVAEDPMTEEES